MTFTIARNERTTFYEVHKTGCFHLRSRHLEGCGGTYEAVSGSEVKTTFDESNEGCLAVLGPCAKGKGQG